MILDHKPYTLDRVMRLFLGTAVLVAGVWALMFLADVLVPFAVAFVMAYLLNPAVLLVQRKIQNRAAAVFLTLGGVVIIVLIVLAVLIPLVRGEMVRMSELLVKTVKDGNFAERLQEKLPPGLWEGIRKYATQEEVVKLLQEPDFFEMARNAVETALPTIKGLFSGAAGFLSGVIRFVLGLMGLLVVALYLVFMLMEYQRVKDEWENLIPPAYREPVLMFLTEFDIAMSRHFRAQAVVAGIVGILFAIGFWLIDLPMAILLGLFIGLLNMVPYLQIAGLIPAGLLATMKAMETGDSLWAGLALTLLVFVIVQVIQDTVLTPRIMGDVTGLSPAMILLSISVWGKLLGFLGLVIALPMTCLALAYYRRIVAGAGQSTPETGGSPPGQPAG